MEAALNCHKVVFSYDGQRNALRGVDLEIPRGQFVAVLGPNGCGKSTLAKQFNSIVTPDSGKILVLGHDTTDPDELFFVRSHCGLVFQNPDDQIVASTVEDDVAFGPENLGLPANEIRERVDGALASVAMTSRAKSNPANLSGGQKQRVAIADIIALNPDIVVLDEPCAMLDLRGRRGIHNVCQRLHESGITIVLITHFMQEALLADRIVVMDRGRVVMDGDKDEVFSSEELLTSLGLEVPLSVKLVNALQEHGIEVNPTMSLRTLKEELCRLYSTM